MDYLENSTLGSRGVLDISTHEVTHSVIMMAKSNMSQNSTEEIITENATPIVAKIAIGISLTLIGMMTVGGNILVLLAVSLNKRLRTTTNYFVVNLAVADLLLGILVLPFSIILQLEKQWLLGKTFCTVWAATDVLCCTASILSLCAISIDRYIGVTRPLKHRSMSNRITISMIAGLWLLSFAISLAPLVGWRDRNKKTVSNSCTVTSHPAYVVFSSAFSFYIPALVIICIYARIYKVTLTHRKFLKTGFKTTTSSKEMNQSKPSESPQTMVLRANTRRNIQSQTDRSKQELQIDKSLLSANNSDTVSNSSSLNGLKPPTIQNQNSVSTDLKLFKSLSTALRNSNQFSRQSTEERNTKLSRFRKETKAAKTLGIVVGVFLLCWFPFFLILPLDAMCTSCTIPPAFFDIVFWLGYCNSMLNPIIYATWSREFKKTFKRILKCKCTERPSKYGIDRLAQSSAKRFEIFTSPSIITSKLTKWKRDSMNFASVDISTSNCQELKEMKIDSEDTEMLDQREEIQQITQQFEVTEETELLDKTNTIAISDNPTEQNSKIQPTERNT